MRGLINALLGKKEKQKEAEKLVEIKAGLAGMHHAKTEEPEDSEGGGVYYLISKAYGRLRKYLSKKSNDPHALATGGAIIAVLIVLLSYTSLFFYMRGVVLAIVFIIFAALSKLIQKLFPFVVGFDLCLFFTVLFSVAYHPFAGIAVGIASSALGSTIFRGQYNADKVIFPLFGYAIIGLILMVFTTSSIYFTGMLMALTYALIMSALFWGHIDQTITFFTTTMLFNYWLFSNYAKGVLMLLGAP